MDPISKLCLATTGFNDWKFDVSSTFLLEKKVVSVATTKISFCTGALILRVHDVPKTAESESR